MKKFICVVLLVTAFGFLAWAAANPSSQRSSKQIILEPNPNGLEPESFLRGSLAERALTSERSPGKFPAGFMTGKGLREGKMSEPSPHLFFPQDETLACDDECDSVDVDYNGVDEWNEAVRLTPSGSCSLIALLFWPSDPDSEAPDLTWGVWDDDGPGGLPATLLDSGTETPDYDQWFRVDLGGPIFIPFGDDIYIGWLDENGDPYYVNGLDSILDSCNYWYDGVDWILDPWFDGDFLIRGICELAPLGDDVAPISVTNPGRAIPQGTSLSPEVTVRNLGTNTATFDVICDIDSVGSLILVYSDTVNITGLSSLTDTSIIFSIWSAANAPGVNYQVMVHTTLGGDENPGNDTLVSTTVTYDPSKVIQSPYTASPPIIDGSITPEWAGATTRDVSDLIGTPDANDPFGSAAIYVMNDAANLYMAVDAAADLTVDDFDQIALYFDDNNDHAFPTAPDTSEGNYWLWKITGADSLSHRWIQAGGVFGNEYLVGYPGTIGNGSGHQQFELQIPLGTLAQELNASAGDTVGFFILAINGFDFSTYGWWPYDTDTTTGWYTPSVYGDIILDTVPIIHDGAMISIDSLSDTLCTDSTYTPCVTVVNFGNVTETFDVDFSIPTAAYDETTTVSNLAPSGTTQVCFPDWTVPSTDSTWYAMTACVQVAGDTSSANDCITDSVFARMCVVGIEETWKVLAAPKVFALGQCTPNPFHRKTDIRYQIPAKAEVSLKVYDLSGRLVRTLKDEAQEPGCYTVAWDGRDNDRLEAPSGIYLYRMMAGEFVSTQKLVLLR